MRLQGENGFKIPNWLLIYPALLTLWSIGFSIWFLVDSVGAFATFGIPTQAEPFILQTSASRYLGIAMAMALGIWIFRTLKSVLTGLIVRLTMDIFDTVAGFRTSMLDPNLMGFLQPFVMFLGPNLFTIIYLWILQSRRQSNES
ncbi:hypothetical protein KFU94_11250 [Chloroflexi bacterium TSY]|nr:hypothetical protein [Chloroflexi bacterium TSY]